MALNRHHHSERMKTIFIIIGGLADIPDSLMEGKTPLMAAVTPSLDALARCGCCGSVLTVDPAVPLSPHTAILSLLGYDFRRGMPAPEELAAFGRNEPVREEGSSLRYFVLPKFSGHGVVISDDDMVNGIGRMALLNVERPYGENSSGDTRLREMAEATIRAIERDEFVLVYIHAPRDMSLKGSWDAKVESIEDIDREYISPVADYVWGAKQQMNMVVVSDCISSWRCGMDMRGEVPAVVYFNDDPPYDTDTFDEESVVDGPLGAPMPGDLIRRLMTFETYYEDSQDSPVNL